MSERTQYFGVCIRPPGIEGKPGRIRLVGELYLNDDGHWANVANFDIEQHSPSEHIFWPQHPPALEVQEGAVIRFGLERTRFYGDPRKDWHSIRRRWDGAGQWDYTLFGAPVYNILDVEWNGHQQRAVLNLGVDAPFTPATGSTVYFRKSDSGRIHLIGPWSVRAVEEGRVRLIPRDGVWVCDFPVPPQMHNVVYLRQAAGEFFLGEPDAEFAEVIDLAPNDEVRRWLVEQIQTISPRIIGRLDQEDPQWRQRLSNSLESLGDPLRRKLAQKRWADAEKTLAELTADEAVASGLLENPVFHDRLHRAIEMETARAIERRAAQLTAEARKQVPSYDELVTRNQEESEELQRQVESRRRLLSMLDTQVEQAASHYEESRDRLVMDFLGFQECVRRLERGKARQPSAAPANCATAVEATQAARAPEERLEDSAQFVRGPLHRSLTRWVSASDVSTAEGLHFSLLGCRWTWVPNVAWACAYHDAFASSSRLMVVSVEPTWQRFSDAWNDEVREFWEQAIEDPSKIYLLAMEGADRASTSAWVTPWLHIIAGAADRLPGAGHAWPANLRMLASRCRESCSSPLHPNGWHCGGAAPPVRSPAAPTNGTVAGKVAVSASTWLDWASASIDDATVACEMGRLGMFARSAALDVARLSAIVRRHNRDDSSAATEARRIRLERPWTYFDVETA